jgi:hypothetical protein
MLIHNPKAGVAVLLILAPLVLAGTAAGLWLIVDGALGLIRPSRRPAKRAVKTASPPEQPGHITNGARAA